MIVTEPADQLPHDLARTRTTRVVSRNTTATTPTTALSSHTETSNAAADARRAVSHAHRLVAEALDELGYEDSKAARLTAATSVAVSALVAGLFAGEWSPSGLSPLGYSIWLTGAVTAVVGVTTVAGAAVTKGGTRPRSEHSELSFHGHAARYRDPAHLTSSLLSAGYEPDKELSGISARL